MIDLELKGLNVDIINTFLTFCITLKIFLEGNLKTVIQLVGSSFRDLGVTVRGKKYLILLTYLDALAIGDLDRHLGDADPSDFSSNSLQEKKELLKGRPSTLPLTHGKWIFSKLLKTDKLIRIN